MTRVEEARKENLLEAAILYFKQYHPNSERWLRLGYAIAQEDGHKYVAQKWYDAACEYWQMMKKARRRTFNER